MKRVILESPYKGANRKNTEENLRFGRLCVRDCLIRNEAPFASHLLYTQEGILEDKVLEERQLGILAGFAWKEIADSTVIYINRGISHGMHLGIRKTISVGQAFEYRTLPEYANKFPRPIICTISGASGTGKTTVVRRLLSVRPGTKLITSLTSRSAKPSDLPDEYQHDIPKDDFERHKNTYLWIVSAHENLYGTTRKSVEEALATTTDSSPRFMILVPDAVKLLRDHLSRSGISEDRILSFYILSPSEQELRRRLGARGDERATIQKRIADCKEWDTAALNSNTPYIFLPNSRVEATVKQMSVFF